MTQTWASGHVQMHAAGVIYECGFPSWFYFLAVFEEMLKVMELIKKCSSKTSL